MDDILSWNMYYGPALLFLAIVLQGFFLIKPKISFIFPCVGALCMSAIAFVDSDITLFLGQMALLFLQFCLREKSPPNNTIQ